MSYTFRKVRMKDAIKFSQWGAHEDIRFYQYNFAFEHPVEYINWYLYKQKFISRKLYGYFDSNDMPVAFITLKHIDWFNQSAEMGIAVDPSHLGEGIGRAVIASFLKHVFRYYPINSVKLKVAVFNERAQRCYKAVGFKIIDKVSEPFEEQRFKDEILKAYTMFFTKSHMLYTEFYEMQINKSQFQK